MLFQKKLRIYLFALKSFKGVYFYGDICSHIWFKVTSDRDVIGAGPVSSIGPVGI